MYWITAMPFLSCFISVVKEKSGELAASLPPDHPILVSACYKSQEGYRYKESYFGDMIDALNLNPAKVKKMLVENGYTVFGRFPDKKYRDGKEQVSYEQFYHELIDTCCGANLLTYIGKVNLQEL